ncbi:MAG: hypothetical protein M3N98_11370 [Actinomycetota bacterium]|nr:hypothetical protein [Actinomycetota bacterium]
MDLGGTWRAIVADDNLRRVFADRDTDDADWTDVPVPHHWRSVPEFADTDGPLLYRRRLETPTPDDPAPNRRSWLRLDGLFYQGDVWLDGAYLGNTEGYFFPHTFEVTDGLRTAREHVLAIEVACSRPADRRSKRNLTGVFQHWDCIDGDWNPGGIWRPVQLIETGPVRLSRLRVLCLEATSERAIVEIRAELETPVAATVQVATTIADQTGTPVATRRAEHPLAAGPNDVRWKVVVDQPDLWWPHALGDQPLYDVTVEVSDRPGEVGDVGDAGDAGGEAAPSDRRSVRTGLRRFEMKNFISTVNGERLFLKGANQGPTRRALGEATADEIEADVVLARQAGLDLLRVHGHIGRPELYAAADRHGLLLWQDLPLQWGYSGVRQQAIRQATEAVDLLGHHPSVAIWCGHNEPLAIDPTEAFAGTLDPAEQTRTLRSLTRRFWRGQLLPTWNKSVLDRSIVHALEKADSTRPVVAHSGIFPHPAWGTDSHLYLGWYVGDERDLPWAMRHLPVLGRFVSEFGAQAVPTDAGFCQPQNWPDLDWPRLARVHGLQKAIFDQHVPPAEHATFESWRDATQAYQARLIRFHIETLRRLKYRPTGGFCQFCLADSQPAVSWSVLDHQRQPKSGYQALAGACAPVIVVADRPAESYQPGQDIRLDIHVVSDLRVAIVGAVVHARLSWPGGNRAWSFQGDLGPDSCVRVGSVQLTAPDAPGPLVLDLDLERTGGQAHNRYESHISSR